MTTPNVNPALAELPRVRPYHASLASFHCFCGRVHIASDEVIRCQCGRDWAKQEGEGGGR